MTAHVKYGVRGEVELHAYNPTTGKTRFLHEQKNLITNTGMDDIGTSMSSPSSFWPYCRVGTGSTTPAFTDTALATQRAVVLGPSGAPDFTTGYVGSNIVWSRRFQFATGAASGNLTEVGLSVGAATNLCTRALFVDGGGSPITITVLADEQLIVIYRIIWVINLTDSILTTSTGPGPISYTLTLRPAGVGVTAGSGAGFGVLGGSNARLFIDVTSGVGPTNGVPTGTLTPISPAGTLTKATYVPGSFARSESLSIPPASGNYANIGAFFNGDATPCQWQIGISPRMTKVNTQTVTFGVTYSWSRA